MQFFFVHIYSWETIISLSIKIDLLLYWEKYFFPFPFLLDGKKISRTPYCLQIRIRLTYHENIFFQIFVKIVLGPFLFGRIRLSTQFLSQPSVCTRVRESVYKVYGNDDDVDSVLLDIRTYKGEMKNLGSCSCLKR